MWLPLSALSRPGEHASTATTKDNERSNIQSSRDSPDVPASNLRAGAPHLRLVAEYMRPHHSMPWETHCTSSGVQSVTGHPGHVMSYCKHTHLRCRMSVCLGDFGTVQAPRVKKVIPKTPEQLKDIETAISRCFLFSALDDDQRKEVGPLLTSRRPRRLSPVPVFSIVGLLVTHGKMNKFCLYHSNGRPLPERNKNNTRHHGRSYGVARKCKRQTQSFRATRTYRYSSALVNVFEVL